MLNEKFGRLDLPCSFDSLTKDALAALSHIVSCDYRMDQIEVRGYSLGGVVAGEVVMRVLRTIKHVARTNLPYLTGTSANGRIIPSPTTDIFLRFSGGCSAKLAAVLAPHPVKTKIGLTIR